MGKRGDNLNYQVMQEKGNKINTWYFKWGYTLQGNNVLL